MLTNWFLDIFIHPLSHKVKLAFVMLVPFSATTNLNVMWCNYFLDYLPIRTLLCSLFLSHYLLNSCRRLLLSSIRSSYKNMAMINATLRRNRRFLGAIRRTARHEPRRGTLPFRRYHRLVWRNGRWHSPTYWRIRWFLAARINRRYVARLLWQHRRLTLRHGWSALHFPRTWLRGDKSTSTSRVVQCRRVRSQLLATHNRSSDTGCWRDRIFYYQY